MREYKGGWRENRRVKEKGRYERGGKDEGYTRR
jgi:hypothetical protein